MGEVGGEGEWKNIKWGQDEVFRIGEEGDEEERRTSFEGLDHL